jgi:adenine-specific DNA-methyltransferase
MAQTCANARVEQLFPDFVLFNEDCLETAKKLPDGSIDLIYLDPPFFSGRTYGARGLGFADKWNDIDDYLRWINLRLGAFHRVLKPTGTIYLHCDWHASHYLKILADEVFGYKNFLNEIIWKRQSCHSDVRQGARHFGRVHDTIFAYTKSSNYVWNQQYAPYDKSYIESAYRHIDKKNGRRYALGDLTAPGGASKGNARYRFMGVERYWRYSKERMHELFVAKRIHYVKDRVPLQKRYLDEMQGMPLQDVWTDIQPASKSRQELGYPTQKPERLLERIILTSTKRGQIVFEAFAGSGTGGAASFKLSRKWVGSETSKHACHLILNRMRSLKCKVEFRSDRSVA